MQLNVQDVLLCISTNAKPSDFLASSPEGFRGLSSTDGKNNEDGLFCSEEKKQKSHTVGTRLPPDAQRGLSRRKKKVFLSCA